MGVKLTYFITAEQMERLRGIFKTKVQNVLLQKKPPDHFLDYEITQE
jgi:hypothetical protein